MIRSVLQHGLALLHRLTTEEEADERDSQRWGLPGGAPECERRTQKTNVCFLIKATRGSSWSLRACHSQPDELFLSCTRQTTRGSDAIFVCSLLRSVDCCPPPPSEKVAQNIIESKYGTGGEAEPLKHSYDRRLLTALMGFQCKKSRMFNLLSGRVGGALQNRLRYWDPGISFPYHRRWSAKAGRMGFLQLRPGKSTASRPERGVM